MNWFRVNHCRLFDRLVRAKSLATTFSATVKLMRFTRNFGNWGHMQIPEIRRSDLALIREHCREDFARTYQLHCDGVKWEDIGAEFGISIQGVQGRLRRIAKVFSEAAPRAVQRSGSS